MHKVLYLVISLCCAHSNETYNSVTFKKSVKSDCNCTEYNRSFQKVLSRQKRWFVFPKGASVLLTMVVTKTVLDGIPRGVQESMEVEMGFLVPPWIEGWNAQPYLESLYGPAVNGKPLNANQSTTISAQPKIDKSANLINIWNKRRWHNSNSYRQVEGHTQKYDRQKYSDHHSVSFPLYPATFSNPTLLNKRNKKPSVDSTYHHREHRERRQIFEKFEGLGKYLGIDIKACIMRAICEVRKGLLPEGESFIQDVARLVFMIPIDDALNDDYKGDDVNEDINCVKKFSVTCPFSPMEFLVKSGPRAPPNWNGRDFSL